MAHVTAIGAQGNPSPWSTVGGNSQFNYQGLGWGTLQAIRWQQSVASGGSPTIGADGTIYCNGAMNFLRDGSSGPSIAAYNPQTGAILWSTTPPNGMATPPVLGLDGTIFVLEGDPDSTTGDNMDLAALNPANGDQEWIVTLPEYVFWGPVVGKDGTLYVFDYGSPYIGNPAIYAIDPGSGLIKWSNTSLLYDYFQTLPVVAPDGTIYVFTGGGELIGINPTDGSVKSDTQTVLSPTLSAMSVGADGTVYIAMKLDTTYQVYAYTEGGAKKWVSSLVNVTSAISICIGADQTIYGTDASGGLFALSGQTGQTQWTLPDVAFGMQPVVDAQGTIYVQQATVINGNLLLNAYNGKTGILKWSYEMHGFSWDPNLQPLPALAVDGSLVLSIYPDLVVFDSIHVVSITLNPTSVAGGSPSTGTVTLSGAAPAGGESVVLSNSNTTIATLPTSLTIAAGSTTGTFQVKTIPVDAASTATITAQPGINQSAVLTVEPAGLASISLNPTTVLGGTSSTGTVTVGSPAGPSGVPVSLSSSSKAAGVPSTVNVASGQTTATFKVATTGVSSITAANIGATLGSQSFSATLTINPAELQALTLNPATVTGGTSSTGTITLSGPAGPNGDVVNLSSGNSNASVPVSVTVAANQSNATFQVSTTPVNAVIQSKIVASLNGQTATATLTINPPALTTLTLNPTTVLCNNASTGMVTLSGSAGPSGFKVALASNNAVATVPGSVTVAANQLTATFNVTTTSATQQVTATITASAGSVTVTAPLTVTPLKLVSLTVNPTAVNGGTPSAGAVTISGPASSGGIPISLSSSSAAATVPSSVTVASGQSSASFKVATTPVSAVTSATIQSTLSGNSLSVVLMVNPPVLTSMTLSPTSVVGGNPSTGTLGLSGPAPNAGFAVALSSGNSAASLPRSVSVASGQSGASFIVTTSTVASQTSATITATAGSVSKTAGLTLMPLQLISVSVTPSAVVGGKPAQGAVNLNGPALLGGARVMLKSSVSGVTVPASVTIPAGQTSAGFAVATVAVSSPRVSTLTAVFGATSVTTTLTVNPPSIASISVSPAAVTGSKTSMGTATLNGAAPTGGISVKLSSSSSSAKTPASVTIATGKTTATFTVTTLAVANHTTATISGALNGQSASATLTLLPPVVMSISLSPTSVIGGRSATGRVTLNVAAPKGGIVVTLASGASDASVPNSVIVPAGSAIASFTVKTTTVASKTTTTISATTGTTTVSATLTIT